MDELTTEEKLDIELRANGSWDLEGWRGERSGRVNRGKDGLRQRMEEDSKDLITTIYADDTQSRTAAKTLKELEKRNGDGLTKVCKELKSLRLKVNEGKTVYMVMATPGIRRRDGECNSQISICGKVVKNVKKGKVLGLIVSDDLSWRDQVDKVVKSCTAKLSGLWRCTSVLNEQQRKIKAEGIILPQLYYCLETTSTGLKANMERLQGVQSAAARWVLQIRRRDWSLRHGLKKLGWLSICQQAAFQTVKMAIMILKKRMPERLYESLTHLQDGQRVRKVFTEENINRLKLSTRKAWSVRALRWLEMMPASMLNMDLKQKSSKKILKTWIKHRVPVRGDKVLWGKLLPGLDLLEVGPGRPGLGPDGRRRPDGGQHEDAGTEGEGDVNPGMNGQQEGAQDNQGPDDQRQGGIMEQLETYGGGKVITKQGPGSRAGHQLCLPRRRHSPERGKEDTTACPWSRKVKYKVMHSYGAEYGH